MMTDGTFGFLSDDNLAQKAQRLTNVICAALFFIVMSSIASAFTFTERDNARIDRLHEARALEYTEEAKRIQLTDEMRNKQKTMAHRAELASLVLETVPRSLILAELTNALPPNVSLVDFTLDSKRRATPTTPIDAKLYDVSITLTGLAITDIQVAQLISKLNGSPLLKDVNLVISDQFEQEGDQLRKFVIESSLDPVAGIWPAQTSGSTASAEISRR